MCLTACRTPLGQRCNESDPCGFGEVCVEGVCQLNTCSTSAQCPMEHHCTADQSCEAGCVDDGDCYPGDACEPDGTCAATACEDTRTDCDYREFCNAATGDCYDAGDAYCQTCEIDADCDSGTCWSGYCGVDCETSADCPAAFDCVPVDVGDTQRDQCLTACWLYENLEK